MKLISQSSVVTSSSNLLRSFFIMNGIYFSIRDYINSYLTILNFDHKRWPSESGTCYNTRNEYYRLSLLPFQQTQCIMYECPI